MVMEIELILVGQTWIKLIKDLIKSSDEQQGEQTFVPGIFIP